MPIISEGRLQRLRGQFNYTQESLAEAADVSVRTVQRAEEGNSISAKNLAAIADTFGMSSEELTETPEDRLEARLSKEAKELAVALIERERSKIRLREEGTEWKELEGELQIQISIADLLSVLQELKAKGLVRYAADTGGVFIRPTYALFHVFRSYLDYDPEADFRLIAEKIYNRGSANGSQLQEDTKDAELTPARINRAVRALEASGYVELREYSDLEYPFGWAKPTWKMRAAVN